MRKNKEQKEDAVSPVVGVMLMLVVTIIIAAVVSGFAGGLVGSQEKAPQASIQVKTGYGYDVYGYALDTKNFDISFEHMGGDPLPTKDMKIITYLTLPNGTVVQHQQDAQSEVMRASGTTGYARLPFIRDQMLGKYYNTTQEINAGQTNPLWFGKYIFKPGMVVRTYKKDATAAFLGLVPKDKLYPADDTAYAAGAALLEECIQTGCPVEIKWLHVPSGKYVLDTTITLQG